MISANVAPIDDPTEEPAPLICPGCGAIGDAPCEPGCVYADDTGHTLGYVIATTADAYHDEQSSSDADPSDWDDIF